MKKGISAVIAVVLILMITVALSAAAYVWFSEVFDTITEGAGEAAEGTADVISTQFSIAASTRIEGPAAQIVVANTGSTDIDLNILNVIVDDQLANKTGNTAIGTLKVGDVATIEVDDSGAYTGDFCGAHIKVIYGSLNQVTSLPACVVCGDGVIEGDEECDDTDLDGNDCVSIDQGFTSGDLACDACTFDTSACVV